MDITQIESAPHTDSNEHSLNLELQALLEMNRAIGKHLVRDELFGALASALKKLIATQRFGIEIPIEGDKLQGHILSPTPAVQEPTKPTVLPAEGTVCNWVIRNRKPWVSASVEDLRAEFPVTYQVMSGEKMESLCALPLINGGHCHAALFFMASEKTAYNRLRAGFLEQLGSTVAIALDNCLAHEELRRLRNKLEAEKNYLTEEIEQEHGFDQIIGQSGSLNKVLRLIEQVAKTESTVLILGETGTGKELIARAIHNKSRRKDRVLVAVNCAALSRGLIESELFGHEKGAFTGALARRKGRFELADGGTLFLDEVGELPLETQVRLLRVLQEQEFERVGGTQTVKVDVRLITATNRKLEYLVRSGAFRSDLFYRLNVFPIQVPPLRERPEDIALLANYFVKKFSARIGRSISGISSEAIDAMVRYSWPGNVREFSNILERAVILCEGGMLESRHLMLHDSISSGAASVQTLESVERMQILKALEKTGGVVGGDSGAAKLLGLKRTTLLARLKKLGITTPTA